jgi:hypothetical protein
MTQSSLHRRMAALLVIGVLEVPLAASASNSRSPSPRPTAQATAGFIASLWKSLAHLWAAEGCGIDPYGRCTPSPGSNGVVVQPPHLAEGCGGDPYGRCAASPTGSGITAQPQSPVDAGCGLDPYGRCNATQ